MRVPILMYHQVAPQAIPFFRKYTVPPKAFGAQMAWLSRNGYSAISLDTWLAARENASLLPPRPVVITFDDGFQGVVDHAVPILERYGYTATFFLVSGLVGQTSRWLSRERGIELPLLDWDAARRLTGAGFHVGCHSVSHPRLTELRSGDCRRELQAARERLEDKLGRAVVHLAYPFGSWNDQVRQLAAESGFRTGCTVCPGLAGPDDDPLTLPRVPVTGDDSLVDFMVRLHRAHSARELVRDRSLAWVDRARKMLV